MSWLSGRTPTGTREIDVACPRCGGALAAVISCLQVRVTCPGCGRGYSLAELAPVLDDESFERLEQAVGGRLSDRV